METEPTTQTPIDPNLEIRVHVAKQKADLLSNGEIVKSWPISTSQFGLGFEPGSFKTPTGRFRIAEKIGDGAIPWSVFKSRVATGEIASANSEEDGVLTRILWLEGLDPENSNTKNRFIYIHGTNQEDRIGTPASHGCIRLRNSDIVEFFSMVPVGARVIIA